MWPEHSEGVVYGSKKLCGTCVALHHDDAEEVGEGWGWSDAVCQEVVGWRILICSLWGGGTRKMRREETGEPLTYASVTVKSPQREGCGGGERESFDRDEQDSGASGQMQRSHAYGAAAWVRAAKKLSVGGGVLLDRLKPNSCYYWCGRQSWLNTSRAKDRPIRQEDGWFCSLRG